MIGDIDLPVTRRGMLAAATIGAGITALSSAPALAQTQKTFVLLHGAWHGGWCWRRVADLLERKGHKVFSPTLTGAREKVAKKTYIRVTSYPQPTFDKAMADFKADRTWRTLEATGCGHDVMVDKPDWLADVLLQVS